MQPYMIGNEVAVAYREAYEYSLRKFASKDPFEMARNSGSIYCPDSSIFSMQSLGQWINVRYPDGKIIFKYSELCPIWKWRFLILNYLVRANDTPISNKLISYRQLDGGDVYYPAFIRSTIKPLADRLSIESNERIKLACLTFTNYLENEADISAVFHFMPRFPVMFKMWQNDEELEASVNLLFDASANHYLHTEDVVAVGNVLSYFLVKQCELLEQLEPDSPL